MVTIIIYDIKAGKEYNRIKRNFYYHLKKLDVRFLNKSVIEVPEESLDPLINTLKKYSEYIDAYIIEATTIQEL